jgi:hypothetical protein
MPFCLIAVMLLLTRPATPQERPEQESPQNAPYVERNQRQFNFYPGGKLQIDAGVPGNVKVIGWQRATVLIEYETVVYSMEQQQARALVSQYPVRVRYNRISGTIRTSGPPQAASSMEINLTLHVPMEKTDVYVRVSKGDLAVDALTGWIEATLLDGSIETRSLNGYFSGTTQQGNIDVQMAGKHWSGLGFTGVTRRGSVTLAMPADFSAALQLETRDGNFSIDYPEQLVEGESVPLKAVTRKNARTLTATVGDGGSPVKLMTFAGNIQVTTKPTP